MFENREINVLSFSEQINYKWREKIVVKWFVKPKPLNNCFPLLFSVMCRFINNYPTSASNTLISNDGSWDHEHNVALTVYGELFAELLSEIFSQLIFWREREEENNCVDREKCCRIFLWNQFHQNGRAI